MQKLRAVSDWCLHHFGAMSEGDVAFGACCEEVQPERTGGAQFAHKRQPFPCHRHHLPLLGVSRNKIAPLGVENNNFREQIWPRAMLGSAAV